VAGWRLRWQELRAEPRQKFNRPRASQIKRFFWEK